MKQRTSFKLTITFDILQELPDDSTHKEVIEHCDSVKLTLERETIKTLTEDYGNNAKVIVTSLPIIK